MRELVAGDLTAEEAREFVERVRASVEDIKEWIVRAVKGRAWLALGYGSWDEMCEAEFDGAVIRLPREDRREAVASLREAGLSTRAIGSALGVDQKTVVNDVRATEENSSVHPANVLSLDGRTRPASQPPRPTRPEPEPGLWYGGPVEDGLDLPADQDRADAAAATFDRRTDRPAPVMLTLLDHTGKGYPYPQPQSKATFNETKGEGISWAAWSWNPVTGCLHGCDYCYARAIANRWTDAYPAGFTPLRHKERDDAPANTVIPAQYRDDGHKPCGKGDCKICAYRRVFVCSMADLYGRWVPDEWIDEVHASMLASPAWEYMLLTKFPARYVGLDLPPNAWVGTSVDEQKRVRIAENAFREIDGVKVKWLSLEPLREPLGFTDLSMFDFIVIGAQTETMQPTGRVEAFNPPREWVTRITDQAKEAGCDVHWKPNLRKSMWFDEFPEV
jgi:protein gp37